MQTSFTTEFLQTSDGQRVNEILRKCVHCGFCNATCPTYEITGNELDGPRGRIYLIKNFFEDQNQSGTNTLDSKTRLNHLDRCLTCLSCETTCPSGVKYRELVDIGRKHIEKATNRSFADKIKRKLIVHVFSNPSRTNITLTLARLFKPFLPHNLAKKVPNKATYVQENHNSSLDKKVLTIKGCVQSSAAPQINAAAINVFQNSKIQTECTKSKCCGALAFHLTETDKAHKTICENIDDWYEKLNNGYDYLSITSSGCSNFIKQYSTIMQHHKSYANKAKFISERCRDASEFVDELIPIQNNIKPTKVAFHNPCTLQHGQNISGIVEEKLKSAGYKLVEYRDAHMCCGSAGSYSMLETDLSSNLLNNKIANMDKYKWN